LDYLISKVKSVRGGFSPSPFTRSAGLLWLILYGISGMVALGLPAPVMSVLALLAGVLILAGR
jgi:hypothetical protein